MPGILTSLASLAAAGVMMVSGSVNEAAPQNDIDGTLFLVNRQWRVSETWEPELRMTDVPGQVRRMRPDAATALEEMYAVAKEEIKVTLVDLSGYRSYGKQKTLYSNKLKRSGNSMEKADEYVARPGASEHQLGLAMDIGARNSKGNLASSFGKTKGGQWIAANSWRFGFILRYGKDWEAVTGYKYEPWHVRYVGKEYAKEIYKADIPFETWLLQYREKVLTEIIAQD